MIEICARCYRTPPCDCPVESCPDAEIADAMAVRSAGAAGEAIERLDVERMADSRSPRRARA